MDFEFIDENEIEAVRRGRKSTAPAELVEAFAKLPKGKAIKIREFQQDTTDPEYKTNKQTVSATIRTAGKLAGVTVSIQWTPDGIPQVKLSAPKAKVKGK